LGIALHHKQFQKVLVEVHESTENNLEGKKGSFYLALTSLWSFITGSQSQPFTGVR